MVGIIPAAIIWPLKQNSSTIIEDVKAIVQAQPWAGLAYFYFDINDRAKQTTRSLLSSLVLTLTAKSKNHLPMNRLYNKHNMLTLPKEDELLGLLVELLKGFGQTYVVIDALDECDEDYHQLFDEVIKVIHGQQLPHFHLLMTSRRVEDIIVDMMDMAPTEIYLSADLVGCDITSYIYSAVGREHKFRKWGHATEQHIKNTLISDANGMYVPELHTIINRRN